MGVSVPNMDLEAAKASPKRLRRLLKIAARRRDEARLIGWPELAESFERDVLRIGRMVRAA